jgi:hypothetical protein
MNDTELKAKIKSTFRVVESDMFYIQEKKRFCWSYHVNKNYDGSTNLSHYPWWFNLLMFIMVFSFFGVVIAGIALFFIPKAVIPLLISSFIMISCYLLIEYIGTKEKKFSFSYIDILQAEYKIDELVRDRIRESENYNKKKNKKYHYFYTEKQLRKEKLLKLNK